MKKIITILAMFSLFFTGCAQTENGQSETASEHKLVCDESSYQTTCPKKGDKIGIIKTNFGVIKFKLFPADVPETVHNFETLANEGKYNGSIFHRIVKDFMIQGGDFEWGNGTGGYSYQGPETTIAEEFSSKLTHLRWAVSMAKTAQPHTTGSQFFIVQAQSGTHWLDKQHSVFGQVYYGTDVVDQIANISTGENDYPLKRIVAEKILVTEYGSGEDGEIW